MRSRTSRGVGGLLFLVTVAVASLPAAAAAEVDYCAALPESAGVISETPGVGCVGRLPGTAPEGIVVEILDVGSPADADARARALVDALAEPAGCTPYEFTDGTLTEAFDCTLALSVLEAGNVVVSATTAVPAGTLDGQPWWSETTAAVRLVGNRLGLVDEVDEGAAQPSDPGPAVQQTPPQDVAGSDEDDSAPVGAVAAGAAGAAVITGVLVGRTVQKRRRRSGSDADATADPCSELGAMADAINADFLGLEPLRVELWRTWDRWHELAYLRGDLSAEVRAARESVGWAREADNAATAGGGAIDIGGAIGEQIAGAEPLTAGQRWASGASRTLGGISAGVAVYGEHIESTRQDALRRLGALSAQIELLEEEQARVNAEAQRLLGEINDRVDELRRRAVEYRDLHRSRGCRQPPIHLDRLDRDWFDGYTPPQPPVAEPETDSASRTRDQGEIDCAGFGDALDEYRRERDRVEQALRADSDEGVTLGAQLLILEQFERRVVAYRSEIERTIGDLQFSRARWAGISIASGAIGMFPVVAATTTIAVTAPISVPTGILVTLVSCVAGLRANQISPTEADLELAGKLRQIESHIAEVRNRLRQRRLQLAGAGDAELAGLEAEHARLVRATHRCRQEASVPEPPSASGRGVGAEAQRARSILRAAERDVARLAFPGDVGLAAWIDIMLKETAQW